MTEEEQKALPWDYPCIMLLPGRYYHAYGCLKIEPGATCPLGADVMACLWRFEEEPGVWKIQIRTRRYIEPSGDPWDGKDKKQWFYQEKKDSVKEAFALVEEIMMRLGSFFALLHDTALNDIDWLMIEGDHKKFMDEIKVQNKPWLHVRSEKI